MDDINGCLHWNFIFNDGIHSFLPSNYSDGESTFENQFSYLMDGEGIVGTALHELSHENHLQVKVCSYQC